MNLRQFALRAAGPAAAAIAAALLLRAEGQEPGRGKITVCRHASADGRQSARIDLDRVGRGYRAVASETASAFRSFRDQAAKATVGAYRSGLPHASSAETRDVELRETVPPTYRGRTFYFVSIPRGGARPPLLPSVLPREAEIFALEAESMEDVALLAKLLGRRVSLASAQFAQALGVHAHDARVTFSEDGKTAHVLEEIP